MQNYYRTPLNIKTIRAKTGNRFKETQSQCDCADAVSGFWKVNNR